MDALEVAEQVAMALERRGQDYALGGAIALGYWAQPRGTLDVDITLFLPSDRPSESVWLLQEIGCELQASAALASLREHGFCQVQYGGRRLDVFLPIIPFYELARARRQRVPLRDGQAFVWDAATLCVFKMMFFRRKDLADVEQVLHAQRERLDRAWIRSQLEAIFGTRDPRLAEWDELCRTVPFGPRP
jgi:hypothetical protein